MAYASESGSWTYDGETYDHRILIYDSNAANGKNIPVLNPIWNEDYCLYFNEGTNEWIIPAYATYIDDDTKEIFPCMTSTNSNASLYNACNELDKLDIKNYNAGFYNYVAELRCQNETAMRLENGTKQYVIMGNSGSADGLTTYYEAETISNRSNPGTLHVILPDDSEEYVISTLSGNAEELDFNIMYKDKFISIAASSADGAQFSPNGVLKLIGNEEDFKIIIADDEISDGKFDTYTFTGGNTGDITVNVTNEEVFAEGENLRGLKIEASEKDIITTLEIENDSSDVRIEQEGTTLTPIETPIITPTVTPTVTPSIPSHIHTWGSGEVTKLATCTESGWITYTCTSCGMKSVEAISATNHVGEKEIRDAKPATCKAEGYTGDTYCKDCGTLLENGTLLEKIKEHTWSKWNTTSSATVFAPKMQKRTCLICDISDVRLIGEKLTSKITLSAKSLKLKVGQSTKALKVSKMANGDYVTSVESSDTKILKVTKFTKSGSITLKAQKKSGKVKLNINLAGGAKKSIYVTVQKDTVRTAKISGLPKKLILEKGEKKVLKPLIAPITSQEKITYAASNQKVATISSKGVITAKKKGTTKITVKSGKKMHIIEVTVL